MKRETAPLVVCMALGPLQANCYLVACPLTLEAAIIDPGTGSARIVATVRQKGLVPCVVLNTHGHIDHTAANGPVAEAFGIPVRMHHDDLFILHAEDIFGLAAVLDARPSPQPEPLLHGDVIAVGGMSIEVVHTPGHTPGSCCFLLGDTCFSGDTVFAGSVGRTDLPGGDHESLLRSIRERVLTLPGHTRLLPGHGPASDVAEESRSNPFFPDRAVPYT